MTPVSDARGSITELTDEIDRWRWRATTAEAKAERLQEELDALKRTKTFRYTAFARRIYGAWRKRSDPAASTAVSARHSYRSWVAAFDTLDDGDRQRLRQRVAALQGSPTFSVLMPTYNSPESFLRAACDSVLNQIYPKFELCIADDCSSEPAVRKVLESYQAKDPRVKVAYRSTNGHIAAATNSALELASGDWVVFLDHDDELAEQALALMAFEVMTHPEAMMIYSDEDHLDEKGARTDPYFKPNFDPLLLLGQNYVCHLLAVRTDLVRQLGGLRPGFDGSQDYDLVLRVADQVRPDQIRHIPRVLYHWRAHEGSTASSLATKTYAPAAARAAVTEQLARNDLRGEVMPSFGGMYQRVRWRLPEQAPLVSIIIPTRDGEYLTRCVESIRQRTTYPSYEVVVVDNGSRKQRTLDYLREVERDDLHELMVIRDARPFNFAALNNLAVAKANGDVVCLLNDDTEVITPDWLEELVGQVLQPGVGAAGAKLFYEDGRIQHAGIVLGIGGHAGHSLRWFPRLSPGYFGTSLLARSVSASTGACLVVRREAWEKVGGLDEEHLAVSYNDVDFCLRLGDAGWRVVWTPFAELYHFESVSRGLDTLPKNVARATKERAYFEKRWGDRLAYDPYYNPNLTIDDENYSLAWPPRLEPGASYLDSQPPEPLKQP